MEKCKALGRSISKTEWSHRFIHTLDTIPRKWYLELEMCREKEAWEGLVQRFKVTFTFEHESPSIKSSLQTILTKIFSKVESMEEEPLGSAHITKLTL
jgi:hypothetical protein